MLPVKKTLIILSLLCLASGCSGKTDLVNTAKGIFFKFSYPNFFVVSYEGLALKLESNQFTISIHTNRYHNFSYNDINANIDEQKNKIGGTTKVEFMPVPDFFECRKIISKDGDKSKLAYVFWFQNWVGVVNISISLDHEQESVVDSIIATLNSNVEDVLYTKANGNYNSLYFDIVIADGWTGKMVDIYKLIINKDNSAQGLCTLDIYVAKEEMTKDAIFLAKKFASEMGWSADFGSVNINGLEFVTLRDVSNSIVTKAFFATKKDRLAVMVYSASSSSIEQQVMEIVKGFKIK